MKLFIRVLVAVTLFVSTGAFSHMMVAQHGTLNLVNNGAFMVLSLPVSGLESVDDDQDGLLSLEEFTRHRENIDEQVLTKVTLKDENGKRPLQGLIMSLAKSHDNPYAPVSQLIVMGRFLLADEYNELDFNVQVFGNTDDEKVLEITARNRQQGYKNVFSLTPGSSEHALF